MEVVQFRAQRIMKRQPSVGRKECEIEPFGSGGSVNADQSDSMGMSSCCPSELGEGVFKKLGANLHKSSDPEPMEDIVSEKGDRGPVEESVGAFVQVGDHSAICSGGEGDGLSKCDGLSARERQDKEVMGEDRMVSYGRGEAALVILILSCSNSFC